MTSGSRPLVSAVIASRNRSEPAARAVRSAFAQTYEHIEVLLIDDGSSPPLVLPTELAQDPRLETIRLESSVGAGGARNLAVQQARGSLLAFLDDDDEWRPGKIARQVEVLERFDDEVAAVESGFDLWDDGQLVLRYLPRPDRDLARTLLERPCLQPSTVLLRKSAFEATGGFDPGLLRVEDWEFWVRLSDSFRTTAIAEVQVDRRVSDAPTEEILRWYREFVRLVEPRIEALPASERDRIHSTHALEEGALLIKLGRPAEARSQIVHAWRLNPWALRPPAYLVRTLMGEQAWSAGKRAARVTAFPVARALGQDPLVRSW